MGLTQPSLSIRWHFGTPEDFLLHAVRTMSYGTGMPAFFNDEVLVPNMLQAGFALEEARDYSIVGCTEETVPGLSEPWLTGGFLNLPKILELTIFDGYDPVLGRQNRFRSGPVETMETFEAFRDAYFRQIAHYLETQVAALLKTYFLSKGQHVQFNVVDAATLRAAQQHPEQYASLVVRVAGFSVLFTTIDPLLQEDIILRTEIQV